MVGIAAIDHRYWNGFKMHLRGVTPHLMELILAGSNSLDDEINL